MGDAERTNDRQAFIKLGPVVLDAQMETHGSLIASFLYYSLLFTLLLFSIFIL
jgi:hypothetical protein